MGYISTFHSISTNCRNPPHRPRHRDPNAILPSIKKINTRPRLATIYIRHRPKPRPDRHHTFLERNVYCRAHNPCYYCPQRKICIRTTCMYIALVNTRRAIGSKSDCPRGLLREKIPSISDTNIMKTESTDKKAEMKQ